MDVLDRTPPVADRRIAYGEDASQFGDLWMPKGRTARPYPVVVFLHGGWWRAEYGLEYGGHLCAALREMGLAVWSVEYRRVGNGGGWPGTFLDASAGFEWVGRLAKEYPLDLNRVVGVGHSAGAHLAFWLAGRHHVPHTSELAGAAGGRLGMQGLISLAGAVDLRLIVDLAGYFRFAHDKREVYGLMGGAPGQVEERYRAGNPGDLLPLGVPQTLIQGAEDGQIPADLPARWAEKARRQGDTVRIAMVPGADHFDVVDPLSKAWPLVRDAVRQAAFG